MPGFVAFAESTLEVRVRRTVASRMPRSVLVARPATVLSAVDLPVTHCLVVKAECVAGGAVRSIVPISSSLSGLRAGVWAGEAPKDFERGPL